MQAGKLDQRVTIQRLVEGVDDYGQPINEWQDVGSYWAAVEPLQGREFVALQAAVSEITARVRMRWVPGIHATMRVIHGAVTYGISAVIHVKSARRELQLMCTALG